MCRHSRVCLRAQNKHKQIAGEVVFNTGMVGYVENLTDPSYKGQILATTYPLLGNYGVQHSDPDELGLPAGMESDRIHVSAVLCQDYCHLPSHWNADKTLSQWLKENNVPGTHACSLNPINPQHHTP